MRQITLYEIVDWIISHRGNSDAFENYSHNRIASEIQCAVRHECFGLCINAKEEIIGVCLGEKFNDSHCIMIHDILTTHPDALRYFWRAYLSHYSDWTLVGGH